MQRDARIGFATSCFSLLVCQQPETRKFLAVDEGAAGWWLPAGQVCCGETFLQAAYTKALQEAGTEVDITGILAIEHSIRGPKGAEEQARMRVIFFGHPKDTASRLRTAAWKSIEELEAMAAKAPPSGLRGRELLEWGRFVEAGGQIAPLEILQEEDHGPRLGLRTWDQPSSTTAFLCPLTFLSREAIQKRSPDEFKAILLRTPNLSSGSIRSTMKSRFGVDTALEDLNALASQYTDSVYNALAAGPMEALGPDRPLQPLESRIRTEFDTHGFAVVVCRHPQTKQWLAVDESKARGWWLPAGHVDRGQRFVEAALRETEEEAGISVRLCGLLAVERSLQGRRGKEKNARMRVVFLATPEDPAAAPKSVPDGESNGAGWVTTQQLAAKAQVPPPEGLRGRELLEWGAFLEGGGAAFPLSILQEERAGPCKARWESLGAP